jgi:DNA repair exonuclease SbcCD nuclease subunit
MRVYLSSDYHADASTSGLDRFDEIAAAANRVANRAIDHAREGNETLFVFGGDLCDPDTSRSYRAIGLAIDIALRLACNDVSSVWIAGNHDTIENDRGSTVLEPLANVAAQMPTPSRTGRITVVEEPQWLIMRFGLRLVMLPHVARARHYDPAAYIRSVEPWIADGIEMPETFLVVGHLTVPSAERGSESGEFARGRDLVFPVEACRGRWGDRAVFVNGHYHRRQTTRDGVHIPGSLARLRHDEEQHEPGYLAIDFA